MLLIISLLLITDIIAFRLFTMNDGKSDDWFESYQ